MKTQQRGETHTNAKLTAGKVAKMREMRAKTKKSYRLIGEKFRVSTATASRVCTGRGWK